MSRKIMGVTVGTPTSPSKMASEITPAEIGAAPAGFGLGGDSTRITDWNTAKKNGWFREETGSATSNSPFPNFWTVGFVTNWIASADQIQNVFTRKGNMTYWAIRAKNGDSGTFGPWEYVNPEMQLGVEYRTTERYLGKPVYTKAVDCGELPNTSQKTIEFAGNNAAAISYIGRSSYGVVLSGEVNSAHGCTMYVRNNVIRLTTTTDQTGYTATFIVKYYKSSD